jgi:hypothetical protein
MQKVPNVTLKGPSVILTLECAFVQTDHSPSVRIQKLLFSSNISDSVLYFRISILMLVKTPITGWAAGVRLRLVEVEQLFFTSSPNIISGIKVRTVLYVMHLFHVDEMKNYNQVA